MTADEVEADLNARYPLGTRIRFADQELGVATGVVNGTAVAIDRGDGYGPTGYVRVAVRREGREDAHIAVNAGNVLDGEARP